MGNRAGVRFGENWGALGVEVKNRSLKPFRHPSFIIYFLVAVVGIGAWGLWVELFDYYNNSKNEASKFREVFIGIIPAFAAPTCMQLILAERERALRAFSIFLVTACFGLLVLCAKLSSVQVSNWFGAFSTIFAMYLWLIANANSGDFNDDRVDPASATGGTTDPAAPLPGSLDGFTA